MSSHNGYLNVPQAQGRQGQLRLLPTTKANGVVEYQYQLNPGTAEGRIINLPVQATPYHLPGGGIEGVSLESLYAIIGHQLAVEHGSVSLEKATQVMHAMTFLEASLNALLDTYDVPVEDGVDNDAKGL